MRVVVTGAGSGIGRAVADRLAADGAEVAALDLTGPARCDVADPASVDAAFAAVATEWGGLDGLVTCAGDQGRGARADPRARRRVRGPGNPGQLRLPGAGRHRPGRQQRRRPRPEPRTAIAGRVSPPLARPAEPVEIAAAVAFVLSPEASFVTGAAIPVDGGYMAV